MKTALIEIRQPHERFARSINVERDGSSNAVDGYLPTGRAIDAIHRLAAALNDPNAEVAFSITGPYGSGKSSLAIAIDSLLGPLGEPSRAIVDEIIAGASAPAFAEIDNARRRLGAHEHGFVRAVVTAQREPIVSTVLRALDHGVNRFTPPSKTKSRFEKLRKRVNSLAESRFDDSSGVDTRTIREILEDLGGFAPVLLLIDEFGKNLEAFADSRSDADLFLLQDLAEWSRGSSGLPLALITLQHMAFDEYAEGATSAQRREWAKIQGRFEDIVFVESNAQTRRLISASFTTPARKFKGKINEWATEQVAKLSEIGLVELASQSEVIADCWPLHPLSLALLPDLCERYGQNERTLFSFLAGHEPLALPSIMRHTYWEGAGGLPSVRLDHVYDYFVESASTLVGVSGAGSRWNEIDTRIRDARGLSEPQLRVLKCVGLLNLVSAGGTLRASRDVIVFAALDDRDGTDSPSEVTQRLGELEALGVLTYRDFADELRVWQGSDLDIRSLLEVARRRVRNVQPSEVLTEVLPLEPIVLARHSEEFGVLRAFDRGWIDGSVARVRPLGDGDRLDGIAFYCLEERVPRVEIEEVPGARPVAIISSSGAAPLVELAREVAAIDLVLRDYAEVETDWVAQRELTERMVEARDLLIQSFENAFGDASSLRGNWRYKPFQGSRWIRANGASTSQCLSAVADSWYASAPIIRNDIVNRHELSSQAAKARRLLVELMLSNPTRPGLGIDGFGPEHTLYLSVIRQFGFHRENEGVFGLFDPTPSAGGATGSILPAWGRLREVVESAATNRLRVSDVYGELARPPFGIRDGVAPLLLLTWLLIHSDETALYEHGTFRPVLTMDLVERLFRNPGNFEVKYYGSRSGSRLRLLEALDESLGVSTERVRASRRSGSILAVLAHLVALVNALPDFTKRTTALSEDAIAIRRCLTLATEPDELIFRAIPEALGMRPVSISGRYDVSAIENIALRLRDATQELVSAYPKLLDQVRESLVVELRVPSDHLREDMVVRSRGLLGKALDQRVARLLVALSAEISDDDSWTEYVAMNVSGVPPAGWTDEDSRRFFATIHDLGSTFRRLEALNVDLRSRGDGFEALRVTVTRPDARESVKVVWVDQTRRKSIESVVAGSIRDLRRLVSSEAEARDLLLAILAEAEFVDESVASLEPNQESVASIPRARKRAKAK